MQLEEEFQKLQQERSDLFELSDICNDSFRWWDNEMEKTFKDLHTCKEDTEEEMELINRLTELIRIGDDEVIQEMDRYEARALKYFKAVDKFNAKIQKQKS